MNKKTSLAVLLPVMLCFFTMGFVDLVGIASNYVQKDLGLSDAKANMMPSLVFFWFLIFSVPTGMLMNRIGRKKTVLLSIIVTAVSLLMPIFGNSYLLMLVSFSLLGIGNACDNPLTELCRSQICIRNANIFASFCSVDQALIISIFYL